MVPRKRKCLSKAGNNAANDCLGAVSAAKKMFGRADPKILSYEFCSPEVLEQTPKDLRINKLRMLTDEEIRSEIENTLEEIGDPIQVVFANQRCEDCGQVQ